MSVLYFTTEDILSGLFNAQVLGHLKVLKQLDPNFKVTLLVINQPWKISHHLKRIDDIKRYDICIVYLPLLPPMRWYTLNPAMTYLYVRYLSFVVKLFVNLKSFSFIHCRHYLSSMIIQNCGFYNFLFDARSLHIQESIQANKIVYKSKNYNFWLKEEQKLLANAAFVSVVSKSMITYFTSVLDRRIMYCPIIANFDILRFCNDYRSKIRVEFGWESKRIYVYSGSLGLYGINKDYLAKLIILIRSFDTNCAFMFLVSNSAKEVHLLLNQCNLDAETVYIADVKYEDMYKYLSAADIGIHALPRQLDSSTRLGTKVVEYWSAGLPVLINDNVGEAANLVHDLKLGKVLNLEYKYSKEEFENVLFFLDSMNRSSIRARTQSLFDVSQISQRYKDIYNEIV